MIAWRVLVSLGNGVMTSRGPVLCSNVVCQDLELGVILASKIPGALTLWRHQNIIYGISIVGSAAGGAILLVCAGLKKIQDLVPETLTIARLAED